MHYRGRIGGAIIGGKEAAINAGAIIGGTYNQRGLETFRWILGE